MSGRRAVFAVSLLLAGCAAEAGGPCTLRQVASYPVQTSGTLVFVPAMIDGTQVQVLLDTGAQRSVVTAGAVSALGLVSDARNGSLMSGVGGQGIPQNDALVPNFSFAGYDPGAGHYPVVDLPIKLEHGAIFGGIVGGDMLSHFDLDLDVPGGRLGVYEVHGCAGNFLPWTSAYSAIPISISWDTGRPLLSVSIDGVALRAILDTGAASSVIDSAAAGRLGVTAAMLAREPTLRGYGAAGVDFNRTVHRFKSMAIGQDRVADPSLTILDRTLPEADMLLGEDFLHQHRVWISYQSHQLFVAAPRAVAATE